MGERNYYELVLWGGASPIELESRNDVDAVMEAAEYLERQLQGPGRFSDRQVVTLKRTVASGQGVRSLFNGTIEDFQEYVERTSEAAELDRKAYGGW